MFYLYYNSNENQLILDESMQNSRNLELLESNSVLEKLLIRAEMYKKQYKCELYNRSEAKPNHWVTKRIERKGPVRRSEETRRKMSEATSGEGNSQYGKPRPDHVKETVSKKLKEHYKYHKHHREGVTDSEETKLLKSVNNNNKGGWIWICNAFTKEEKRCYGEIPTGWRRGRLHNYIEYVRATKNKDL